MHPLVSKLRTIISEKESNLSVAADLTSSAKVLTLAEEVGDKICVLKTHVDILEDFTPEFPVALSEIAQRKNFLIFEDRKFADIGNTVSFQFSGGIYHIAEWADLINAHTIVGPGIIAGLQKTNKKSGVILLAQMTPVGNLFNEDYALRTVEIARENPNFCIGFIGSADHPEILQKIRAAAGEEFMIFTPGIKLQTGGDDLGQTYNTPAKAVQSGADVIIVGRGICESDNPSEAAEKYRVAGWAAVQNNN